MKWLKRGLSRGNEGPVYEASAEGEARDVRGVTVHKVDRNSVGNLRTKIYDRNNGGNHFTLDAVINEGGDLVLEGFDIGPWVEDVGSKFVGCDIDYEYWRTVKAEHKDELLLKLISDRFDSDTEFTAWLDTQGIPSDFWSY